MSVLVEAISLIIRIEAIERCYPSGLKGLKNFPPNGTLCYDHSLARLGFMVPFDVGNYIERLEAMGFKFLVDGKAHDMVVVNQKYGPTTPCDWLEVIYFDIDDDPDQRVMAALISGEDPDPMAAPDGWTPEQSINLEGNFVTSDKIAERLTFVRQDDSVSVYLDKETGKEVYVGRSSGH
ncbi:MAG: hypothetical protein CL797_08070 [Chromatiales bacterium]|jgi:hypothetical protein|nr:hypothetical protein [Chromatiales bacterium]